MTTRADGRVIHSRRAFRMEIAVSIQIAASAEKVWSLLTTAQDFARWNSTIERIEGKIALGETIRLWAKAAPGRVFKLKITAFRPPEQLVWQDGMYPMFQGSRRYTLTRQPQNGVVFGMSETFSGLMLPMIAGSLPDFGPSFERFAADLKAEAERSE